MRLLSMTGGVPAVIRAGGSAAGILVITGRKGGGASTTLVLFGFCVAWKIWCSFFAARQARGLCCMGSTIRFLLSSGSFGVHGFLKPILSDLH